MQNDLHSSVRKFFGSTPVYIINLKDSTDRCKKVLEQFGDYQYMDIIEAVDGRDPLVFKKKYNVQYTTRIPYVSAVIAVLCSHAKAIKTAYDHGHENACIFEDDVNLELIQRYPYTLNDITSLNNDWDMIQLYYTDSLQTNYAHYTTNGLKLLPRVRYDSGSCYIINRKGMEKMLSTVIATDGSSNFDIMKEVIDPETVIFGHVNTYLVNLPCVYYCSDTMTFPYYAENDHTVKETCQVIQRNSANLLKSFYVGR